MIQYYPNFPTYSPDERYENFKKVPPKKRGKRLENYYDYVDLYSQRCRCKEEQIKRRFERLENLTELDKAIKKFKRSRRFKPFQYSEETITSIPLKQYTYHFQWDQKLSPLVKVTLESFQNKYLYHAIYDILGILKHQPKESTHLLDILYSPAILLHNNYSINFLEMVIEKIEIKKIPKVNKFLKKDWELAANSVTEISITFSCKRSPRVTKKRKFLW